MVTAFRKEGTEPGLWFDSPRCSILPRKGEPRREGRALDERPRRRRTRRRSKPQPAAPEAATPPPRPAATDPVTRVEHQIDQLRESLLVRRTADLNDFVELLGSKRKMSSANFLMGLSRGVGFFLGFSLVGALLVGVVGFAVDWTASTFRSRYNTRTVVRGLLEKYAVVMEEMEEARLENTGKGIGRERGGAAAAGAQIGAGFLLGELPTHPVEDPAEPDPAPDPPPDAR